MLVDVLALGALEMLAILVDEQAPAIGARSRFRALPGSEFALRVVGAPKECAPLAGTSFDKISAIQGTQNADLFKPWLSMAAFREIRASDEFTVSTMPNHKWVATLRAHSANWLRLELHLRHELPRLLQLYCKRLVKLAHNLYPRPVALCYFIQFLFHACGEAQVHNIRKVIDQQVINRHSNLCGDHTSLFPLDISSSL